jgi:Lon protease-like protein
MTSFLQRALERNAVVRRNATMEDNRHSVRYAITRERIMHGWTPTDQTELPLGGVVELPNEIAIFPLPRVVLLPGEVLPLHVFEPRYRELVRDALDANRLIGVVEYASGHEESEGKTTPVRQIGCVGFIAEHEMLEDGRYLIWLIGLERFQIEEELFSDTAYRKVRVVYTPLNAMNDPVTGFQALRDELHQTLPRLVDVDDASRLLLKNQMREVSDSQLIALACQILELPSHRKRAVLEAETQVGRFLMVYEDLFKRLEDHPEVGQLAEETLN